jgi:uncharacterized protein with FMN-binding domain
MVSTSKQEYVRSKEFLMSKYPSNKNNLMMAVRKFFLSAFVVLTFLAYVLHERFTVAIQANALGDSKSTPTSPNGAETASKNHASIPVIAADNDDDDHHINVVASAATATSTVADTPTPLPDATSQPSSDARYKDGTYTGSEADAYYGLVQVQAVIQNGKITDVKFLEYPNHRRTSVQINEQVIPWLQQEAIQAQSAQVDLISGATLTSQAFAESLQVALDSARN